MPIRMAMLAFLMSNMLKRINESPLNTVSFHLPDQPASSMSSSSPPLMNTPLICFASSLTKILITLTLYKFIPDMICFNFPDQPVRSMVSWSSTVSAWSTRSSPSTRILSSNFRTPSSSTVMDKVSCLTHWSLGDWYEIQDKSFSR